MDQILNGQHAVVTGGTSGIGKEIACTFAKYGATVAVIGTNHERGASVVDHINNLYGANRAFFFAVNVADTEAVAETIQKILQEFGKVDILVNNAGITRDQLLLKMKEEDWDQVLAVNAKSAFNLVKALARSMMKARKGKIINISSVVGLTGNAGQVNYASSKAALIGFTKALAKEVAPRNICVNCIAPGFIETPMTNEMTEEQHKALIDQIPLKRLGQPEDIAHMALFLAAPLSDYITGQVLTVDGGMVM